MELAVVVARSGDVFVHFDRYYSQSLFVRRGDVSSFIADPRNARMIVLPPFASSALTCFTELHPAEGVTLKQDDVDPARFTLTVKSATGRIIAYVSDTVEPVATRTLAAAGVDVVITPQMVARVHGPAAKASLVVIASLPRPERPNYPARFLVDPALVGNAVAAAVKNRTQTK